MNKIIAELLKRKYPTEKYQQSEEQLIPDGIYCYYGLATGYFNAKFIYLTRICPYYKHFFWQDKIEGYCTLCHDEIEDQCKICNINDNCGGQWVKVEEEHE